ncbi:MAG: hypothetical protein LBR21_03945 [Propionibacteriaceae bacterium]|nr:hypothetical protein [Propionibacteriaceae bacterium]
MEKTRREREEADRSLEACAKKAGWNIQVEADHTWTPPQGLSKEQGMVYDEDIYRCITSVGGENVVKDEEWFNSAYGRALDTKACLENRGYTISSPPTKESWVQGNMENQTVWNPWQDIVEQVNNGTIELTGSEYLDLYTACPQDSGNSIAIGDAAWG